MSQNGVLIVEAHLGEALRMTRQHVYYVSTTQFLLQARLRRMGALDCVWTLETKACPTTATVTVRLLLLQAKNYNSARRALPCVLVLPGKRAMPEFADREFSGRSL